MKNDDPTSDASAKAPIAQWLSLLEEELKTKALTAGVLGHGTLIGDAREFIVKEVLARFLPSAVSIGRGIVIDSRGGRSDQCDIVVTDNRYPCFRIDTGAAMFPVESVIATIEVKSKLYGETLDTALDNCVSVARLEPSFTDRDGPNPHTVEELFCDLVPRTYVFGFEGYTDLCGFAGRVQGWLRRPANVAVRAELLPAVVVAGGCVGFETHDLGRFKSSLIGRAVRLSPYESLRIMSAKWVAIPTETRFGWLAAHLLSVVARRLNASIGSASVRPLLSTYLPFTEYWPADVADFAIMGDAEQTKLVIGEAIRVTEGKSVEAGPLPGGLH